MGGGEAIQSEDTDRFANPGFRVSVCKARDGSTEMKDVIKEGVEEDGELTYSRLREREGLVFCLESQAEVGRGEWRGELVFGALLHPIRS